MLRPYSVGALYAVLSGLLFVIAFFRSRHSRHDFADYDKEDSPSEESSHPIVTIGQDRSRIFGRPFATAGWIVVGVTVVVAIVEICLLVLILYM